MTNGYPSKAYSEVVEKRNVTLVLTPEQSMAIHKEREITLSEEQIDEITSQLTRQEGMDQFIIAESRTLEPFSFSLFVMNERLWKMMERKVWDPKKMLAMITIPLCTWDHNCETTRNPKGTKRWPIKQDSLDISFEPEPILRIQGEGGDFSGFIEQSQLTMRKWGLPDTRRLLPNYTLESVRIEAKLGRASVEIHPKPRDELDYDFSEHARVFFDHGFLASVPGEDVALQVGKRKPTHMAGDVLMLIGKHFDEKDSSNLELLVDIWLRALEKRMASVK